MKSISGTQQPCREVKGVALPGVADIPPPPTWLPNDHAVEEWHRLTRIVHANGLLTEAGTSALAMLCALHGKIVEMYAAGECPSGHLMAQWRNLTSDFGLTPVAQTKVQGRAEPEDNPFDELDDEPRNQRHTQQAKRNQRCN